MIRGLQGTPAGAAGASAQPVDPNDAFEMALALEQRDDLPAAEEAYAAADRLGHPVAAVKLGVLLEERDDLAGAEQAFRRADGRGDATGAFHLGWLLQERGDLAGAEQAYRRAEMHGHPAAVGNLRVLLARRAAATGVAPGPPSNGAEPAPADERSAVADEQSVSADEQSAPADGGSDEPDTAVHAVPAAAAASAGGRSRGGARDPREGRGGLVRRALTVILPVAAFAAAFLVGEATRPTVRAQPHVAPAVNVSDSTVTISRVAAVPTPPKLVKPPPPKPGSATLPHLGLISSRRGPPVYREPVVDHRPAPTPVAPASAPRAGGQTTPLTTPATKTEGSKAGAATPVTSGTTPSATTTPTTSTTTSTSTTPSGG